MWVLGIEPESSTKAASVLSFWAFAPALQFFLLVGMLRFISKEIKMTCLRLFPLNSVKDDPREHLVFPASCALCFPCFLLLAWNWSRRTVTFHTKDQKKVMRPEAASTSGNLRPDIIHNPLIGEHSCLFVFRKSSLYSPGWSQSQHPPA